MPRTGNGERTLFERARVALRGDGALPIGEALHPVTLAAVALLLVNDWLLKPRYGPSLVTGKLSDLAGLVFAPVVLSAALGLALRLARRDGHLTERRLVACIAATGACFAAVKLSPDAAAALARALSLLGRRASIYVDRTDLLALPALAVAYWIGRDELLRARPAARPPPAAARR